VVRIKFTAGVSTWMANAAVPERVVANALLGALQALDETPIENSPPFIVRVRQARRYRIWRLGHPYRDDIAIRIMVWFDGGEAVICLVAGNKAHLGDLWYDYAAPLAEAEIDRIITTQQ
jgi:hypothetical protein